MHATIQHTIRNVPPALDRVVRKRARLLGKSFNQTFIDDMSSFYNLEKPSKYRGALKGLDWLVGSEPINDATKNVLDSDDALQKSTDMQAKEQTKIDEITKVFG